ncbi:MAG: DNA sulfur modification protein DndE [Sphingomonas sp.]|uniref:DNA sulfur modification protein DndE n=1 Tax=Sphingomonas sp. TaxID=28214 RepID=UPI00122254C8|nr:DNA sulfur modification protein DndE [Sphingomonas sp.]THD34465.1 MAG: DNA sulfur modification protein DndE [Sphingomonas sp.]
MRYTKLNASLDATSRLRSLQQRTGLTPNLLCRIAAMMSLEEGPVGTIRAPDDKGKEFNSYTLTGELTGVFGAMVRFVEEDEGRGEPLANDELLLRFAAHIHRGVGLLSVRAKSPADVVRLAIAA